MAASGRKGRDPRLEQLWRGHFKRWRASGSTIRDYCREHRLAESSFHFWRREIARRDADATPAPPAFVPVVVTHATPNEAATPSEMATPAETPIEIELSGGRVVRVRAGCDRALLGELFAILEGRPC